MAGQAPVASPRKGSLTLAPVDMRDKAPPPPGPPPDCEDIPAACLRVLGLTNPDIYIHTYIYIYIYIYTYIYIYMYIYLSTPPGPPPD